MRAKGAKPTALGAHWNQSVPALVVTMLPVVSHVTRLSLMVKYFGEGGVVVFCSRA